MTHPSEKTETHTKKIPEKALFKFGDPQIKEFWQKKEELIRKDAVFKKIIESLDEGWDELKEAQRTEILSRIDSLINTLEEYRDSCIGFKGVAQKRIYFDTTEKYQETVRHADRREKILHDSLIDQINILSRKMRAMGLDNSWRSDDSVYGPTPEAQRARAKFWMFKIFREKDFAAHKRKELKRK